MGCPVPLTYVELGPGRGLMCADAINAFCKVTDVKISQIQIKLVEISEALKRIQKACKLANRHHFYRTT